ncbi:hypothetical protein NESM_000670300 [Novymonas esmeraldas]|uniref:Uncharacterized protein n=1 Tax=Novymonas esmeraldas TaxID=1808958 RepID=A0AAW0ET67_9TRYP
MGNSESTRRSSARRRSSAEIRGVAASAQTRRMGSSLKGAGAAPHPSRVVVPSSLSAKDIAARADAAGSGAAFVAAAASPLDGAVQTSDTRVSARLTEMAVDSMCTSPLVGPRNNTGCFEEVSEAPQAASPSPLGGDPQHKRGSSLPRQSSSEPADLAREASLQARHTYSVARVRDWLVSVDTVAGTA